MSQYILPEPEEYIFENRDGHSGKKFAVATQNSNALIIECTEDLTVSIRQHECDFNYYVLSGEGYFIFDDGQREPVETGKLVAIPHGVKYTFGGKLKMLLINAPGWKPEQEESFPREDI